LQIQFLKPLFRRKSSTTDSQRFPSRREIFALTIASTSIAILFALGYLLTGWNPANFKDDVLNIMLTLLVIIVGIASPALVFGFRPRVLKYLEKTVNLPKPENQKPEKIDSEQENRGTRKHTENLRTEVYEKLLHMMRMIGISEPYMMDFVVSQGKDRPVPVENLRYLERGIEHLRTGVSYQRAYELWEYMRTLKSRYNDEVREIRKELKKLIILRMEEYLDTFHEHEPHSNRLPEVSNYFCSVALLDFMIDEITLSVNENVKRDFRIVKSQWNSHDGNWYQLEGVSNIGYAILLQSLSPITDQDEAKLRQALSEIRDNVPIADSIRDTIKLYEQTFAMLWAFKEELKKIVEQIKDIEDNYIIEGNCAACRPTTPQSPIEPSND
jgi:hypothetical protein